MYRQHIPTHSPLSSLRPFRESNHIERFGRIALTGL